MTTISERARVSASWVNPTCPHCGVVVEPEKRKSKPRSVPQNKRYHAMINAAFSHWPEGHRFMPMTVERLRKWVQAKAGHAVTNTVDFSGLTPEQSVAALAAVLMEAVKQDPIYFIIPNGPKLHVIQSKSINFDNLSHLAACALFDDVAQVIEAETGLKVDDIMPAIRERKPAKEQSYSEVPL